MKIPIQLIFIFATVLIITNCKSTKDADFIETFQPKHIHDGDGVTFAKAGDRVSVHYTGTFPETGKKFDSSKDRNTPFSFTLQTGQVIRCWDEVVSKMTQGEIIYVICPSSMAYGERGAGGVIPPNANIAFEIEFLRVNRKDEM